MPGDFSSGARLEIRITPADVGKRVSVRQLTEITDGHPMFTDTVGVLASWDAGVVSVTRRTGETVRIAQAALVAGKVVPPAPARRRSGVPAVSAEELAEIAARAWPAVETARLGGWTLRASGGFTRRANSVLVGGEPGLPVDEALAHVTRWYGERGLTPYLQLADSSPLVPALDRRGWIREADSLVRTAPLAPLTSLPGGGEVTVSRGADAGWTAAYHRTGNLAEAALQVLSGGPSVWFASAPGAIGRAVVDGRWAHFGAVEVEGPMRRRGLATQVMGALARQAYTEGATAAYLQVEADNAAARALYDRLGFVDHHGYHYRRPAGPTA
ncbi:FR47-like protein [Streptomyces sp. DvalAA-14]|uniref:GNAT family N-acetyltransferase n=1 Tax=unclassified Streptomyces TaxID=2593676 RepID=UPI00081B0116|nr:MULTISPECIES: GNAT family N-acetyltransferase [unclassified Streptomyces]MYS19425.1 GNAT family N-acetyltransferase [Streptomyces sp. SID4948]SCD44128.1 FR47-like protein [Streptomyces sp. DvalAA-14]